MRRLPLLLAGLACIFFLLVALPALMAPSQEIWYENQVAVIAYHHIDDHVQSDVTITASLFEKQLKDLQSRGYRFITLQQFEDFMSGRPVPANAVMVTFDDGYESFYTEAYPVLKKLQVPAVNFVITKDLDNPQGSLIPSLSREEIRYMMGDSALVDVQCHTDSLHDKQADGSPLFTSRLTVDGRKETDAEFENRIVMDSDRCVHKLAELNRRPIDAFAFPFGALGASSAKLLEKAGFRYAFTTVSEMATRRDDPLQIPRINAGSPFVRAQSLHNLIVKRIVSPLPDDRYIDVVQAAGDLGGKSGLDKQGALWLEYNGIRWELQAGSGTAVSPNKAVTLKAPLKLDRNRPVLRADDVQELLGTHMTYNANTGHFFRRISPLAQ